MADGEGDCQVGPGGARNFDKVGLCPRNLHRAGADLAFLGVMRDDARCVAARSRAHRPAWRVPHRSIMRRVSRGGLRRRARQTAVDRHDREDRVRPIRQQDDAFARPTPVEGTQIGLERP
jgi:hypothetical protein